MKIITPEVKRRKNETLDQYLIRLGENLDLYGLTWATATQLLNAEADEEYTESRWRKLYNSYVYWKDHLINELSDSDEYVKTIEDKTLELKKERVKLQSEKLEYNRMIRENARSELIEEKILRAIKERPTIQAPEIVVKSNATKQDYILPIADVHYGAEFEVYGWKDEIINKYNTEIAQRRMWNILEEFVSINDISKINHVNLVNLGDSLDGILRMSQLQWIQLGNVDSAIEYAEFMATWINELSKYCFVDYYVVSGNHTELRLLNGKRGDFPEENMEKIITYIISVHLKDNERVKIHKCKSHMYFNVLGNNILAVHGHQEKNLEKSLSEYPMLYGYPIDLIISGHLHHRDNKTIGMNELKDIEYYQVPSIVGVDKYSMEIKKAANAGTDLLTLDKLGIKHVSRLRVK